MYRISVTVLEKFRRFTKDLSQYDSEAELIKSIRGVFEGNDKTKIGGAFHKVIENRFQVHQKNQLVIADDIAFTAQQAAAALLYRAEHPRMIHEVPCFKIYQLQKYQIKISGRLDGVEGARIRDAKLIFKRPDFQDYIDSFQWRYYLDILGVETFYYDVFEVQGFDCLRGNIPWQLPGADILRSESLECIRYPELQDDCQSLLYRFMEYIEIRNFFHLLKIENEVPVL